MVFESKTAIAPGKKYYIVDENGDRVEIDIQSIKDIELQRAHDILQKEILDYIVNHENEDPIELLGLFAEKIREILDCDQVIYRDLKDTRFMVNSSGISNKWSVPESYCRQCQHFNAHHPMYKDGYTEMDNCQEGWRGIPVYEKCPIKSSLTRIVYCNGEVAGYLAIHYVNRYHHFTDLERKTSKEFVNNFSLALSKYEAKKQLQKKTLDAELTAENYSRVLALEDSLESIYEVELESGKYLEFVKGNFYQQNVADKLLPKGDYFQDLRGNIDAVIYPEDRDALFNVLDRESVRRALSEKDRVEHYYRMFVGESPLWFKIRIAYKNSDNKSVIIGCFNAEKELAEKRLAKQMGDVKRMMSMILSLSDEYDPIMVLDPETGEYDWYRSMNDDVDINTSMSVHGEDLYQNIGIDGATIIHEDDRVQFQAFYTKENMMRVATTGETQEIENRWFIHTEGIYRWKYNKAVRMEDETGKAYVVIGVIDTTDRKKEEEERKENINLIEALTENNQRIMALEDNFESMYEVELDSGKYTGYVKGEFYQSNVVDKLLEPGDYFEDLRGNIDAVIYPEDRDGLFKILNREAIRQALSANDRFEYFYRIIVDYNPVWFKIRVVYKDTQKTSIIIGVFNASKELEAKQIEEQRESLKKSQEQLQEDMHMIGGLANEYDTLYYVNLEDEVFKVFACDGERYPEAADIVAKGGNPFDLLQQYGASEAIHPDDRKLIMECTAESVKKRLSHSKSFSIKFRRTIQQDFYEWWEMTVIKYEAIDEPANAIAIGFANRDIETRNEQIVSQCYSILSQEMAPQKAINELMSLTGDYYGANRAYIFEFGKEKETVRNTYEWCKEGVEPMIYKLQSVPTKEVEGWLNEFKRRGTFYMDTLDDEHNNLDTIATLEMQGIKSLIAAPLKSGDEIVGFIGVDDPTKSIQHFGILTNIAVATYCEILRRKENDEEHITLQKLTDTFLSVYFADLSRDYMHTWKIDQDYKDAYGSVSRYSEAMGGYVQNNIAVRDRERCIKMTSPEYVLEQFKTKDSFSVGMTDIMLGYERDVVLDYVKVSEDGKQFVICSKDVTESLAKEHEQQKKLEEALSMAKTASEAKSSFLFNMSHDIRTPMNAITGFTTMAKKYVNEPQKVNDYLDKIDVAGQQLLMLINQVLEMSRIESGKVEFDECPVNIKERFDTMTTLLAEQAASHGLEFHSSLKDIEHFNVLADDTRMSQVTLNIIGNAMKYTPEGGRIDFNLREIPARRDGRATYVFTVADTGIGMSDDFLKNLFEPFARENTSTVSKIQGTGLGLSIVKNLVDLAGGNIDVKSEAGKGSRFDITLDFIIVEGPEEPNDMLSEDKNLSFSFKGKRALLVEDNEMNREIAKFILEDKGVEIETAEDGDIAVEIIDKIAVEGKFNYYDFILMDVQMPRMDGYEATCRIRGILDPLGVHIPIIALSANAFEEDRQKSIQAGMDDHVAKPIDIDQLWETLAKFL